MFGLLDAELNSGVSVESAQKVLEVLEALLVVGHLRPVGSLQEDSGRGYRSLE